MASMSVLNNKNFIYNILIYTYLARTGFKINDECHGVFGQIDLINRINYFLISI